MNLSSLSRAQVQMVLMSFQCAIELASKIDGVIFSAYSELTRNVAIKLVPLSQLGEELIRTWSDASNARAAGRPGDAIIFLQCWLFWDCGEINSDRQRSLDRPLPAWKEKREEERLQQACSGRRRLRVLFSIVDTSCGQGRRRSRDPTYVTFVLPRTCRWKGFPSRKMDQL